MPLAEPPQGTLEVPGAAGAVPADAVHALAAGAVLVPAAPTGLARALERKRRGWSLRGGGLLV